MLPDLLRKKHIHYFHLMDADQNGCLEPADWVLIGQRFAHQWKITEQSKEYADIAELAQSIWKEMSGHINSAKEDQITLEEWLSFTDEKIVNGDPAWYSEYIEGVIRGLFAIIDEDLNGTIDWREYINFTSCLGISVGSARIGFEKMDLNGDGIIDEGELLKSVKEFLTSDDPESPGNWLFGPVE